MKTFRDCEGTEWNVSLNVHVVGQVKSLLEIDLLDIADGKVFEKLEDPASLVNVLYVVCRDQVNARHQGETADADEWFGRRMGGDALDEASKALIEELVYFFPKRRRPILEKALAKLRSLESKLMDKAASMLDDPKIDAEIDRKLAELGVSFGSALPS